MRSKRGSAASGRPPADASPFDRLRMTAQHDKFPSAELLAWYARHGRRHLPWRTTRDPYSVVVSEFMLQQTQVERVIPLYGVFLARFPDFATLAAADAGDVVRAWRGLGYNSRAVRLHALAVAVVARHGGVLPDDVESLRALP